MKISTNDTFDPKLCIRGLGILITYMHSDLYEYMYYLTFKRSMKSYSREFNNAWEQSIDHDDFFKEAEDLIVQNCHSAHGKLVETKLELILRFGINEAEDLENEELILQAQRFRPFLMVYKRSKSYKKLKLYYERTLSGFIECLFLYACCLTAEKYRIPLILKKQFKLPNEDRFRLLNQDDNNVQLLVELINGLHADLSNLRSLISK